MGYCLPFSLMPYVSVFVLDMTPKHATDQLKFRPFVSYLSITYNWKPICRSDRKIDRVSVLDPHSILPTRHWACSVKGQSMGNLNCTPTWESKKKWQQCNWLMSAIGVSPSSSSLVACVTRGYEGPRQRQR